MKKLIVLAIVTYLVAISCLASYAEQSGIKQLNNLVVELLSTDSIHPKPYQELTFTTPRDGWVFFSCVAKVTGKDRVGITVDSVESLTTNTHEKPASQEAMRFLPKGSHTLKIRCTGRPTIQNIVVRSIPELIYGDYPESSYCYNFGLYDWAFIEKYIAPNVNTIVAQPRVVPWNSEILKSWQARGKKWIFHSYVPGHGSSDYPLEESYNFWHSEPGMTNPQIGGIIVDEFPGNDDSRYATWAPAVEKLYQDPAMNGKTFYPFVYGSPIYKGVRNRAFAETIMKHGGKFVMEYYLQEKPTMPELLDSFQVFRKDIAGWHEAYPNGAENVILGFGYMSAPRETLNTDPSKDFKVLLDKQMNIAANDPAFMGLYGIHHWKNAYADEENNRWASELYRHYCIEGKKTMLSDKYGFTYNLNYITNPDFDEGLKGWTVSQAEEGSITSGTLPGWGWLQGRYPKGPKGDNFLLMKRSAKGTNSVSQTIRNLKPGKWYSAKMYSADYNDIRNGVSNQRSPCVCLKIDNVVISPKSFDQLTTNDYDIDYRGFNDKHKAFFNYHWLVFKAKGTTATIRICDKSNDLFDPGGYDGQEIMYNFVEVQPYFPAE